MVVQCFTYYALYAVLRMVVADQAKKKHHNHLISQNWQASAIQIGSLRRRTRRRQRLPPTMIDTVITGCITIPEDILYFQSDVKISIALQDTSRIDRPAIDISKLIMEVPYLLKDHKIPFSLSYLPCNLQSETYEWYTLRIRVESCKDGKLLCFNHRVTRAICDAGMPRKDMIIPLITTNVNKTRPPHKKMEKETDDNVLPLKNQSECIIEKSSRSTQSTQSTESTYNDDDDDVLQPPSQVQNSRLRRSQHSARVQPVQMKAPQRQTNKKKRFSSSLPGWVKMFGYSRRGE